jgi:hypothetical protein
MANELFIIVAPPVCAAFGYLVKYFVDRIETAKEGRKIRKLKAIENKLKNFFYPFYSNLKRENLIFQRVLSFFKDKNNNNTCNESDLYMKIFWGLDDEILNIHNENQELIKNNFIEMHFSNDVANLIMNYDEHVSIYRILRKVIPKNGDLDNVLWPGNLGSTYPKNLLKTIENEMIHLHNQQTYILQGNNFDHTYKHLKNYQYRKISNTSLQQESHTKKHIKTNNNTKKLYKTSIDVEMNNENEKYDDNFISIV